MEICHRELNILMGLGGLAFGLLVSAFQGPAQAAPPGFDEGQVVYFDADGTREEIFSRISAYNCIVPAPADAAPDKDTWITVDVPTLNGTNAKAALVFGHAFAQQDGVAEPNGVSLFLSKTGTTPTPASENQLVHTKFVVADDRGDEHAMMIIPLDANKDFDVLYRFGEISGPGADETAMCTWGARLQLVGWIEAAGPSDLVNLSTRGQVLTGDSVQIGGFWIEGADPKTVVIRARGPSMGDAPFNLPGVLGNPQVTLYSGGTPIATNDDWQSTDPQCDAPAVSCGDFNDIVAAGLDPCQPNPGETLPPTDCALESALHVTLPPGGYTAIVEGAGGGTGLGLVEVFDADSLSTARLINLSTRGQVQTGDSVQIGGFWIEGADPKTVVIRARGPSMGDAPFNVPGVLGNPQVTLYSGGAPIAANDDWQSTDPQCDAPAVSCGDFNDIVAAGLDPCQPNPGETLPPTDCALESALHVTLPPGGYTAIVEGAGGGTGNGLVEVFEVLP